MDGVRGQEWRMLGKNRREGPWAMMSPKEQAAPESDSGPSVDTEHPTAGGTRGGRSGRCGGHMPGCGEPHGHAGWLPEAGLRESPCIVLTLLGLRRLLERM